MPLCLQNTLTRKLEPFEPMQPGQVRMYTCGPTVYNYVHIGNLRSFTFQDILRRHLLQSGYKLHHVMNVTDVEDKTIRNANEAGKTIFEYTKPFTDAFFDDLGSLRIQRPEKITPATEYIQEMVDLIQLLEQKGLTYVSEGSVYYRIAGFPDYGKLSHIDVKGMKAGARVDQDEYEKDDVRDFVLWKGAKPGEPSWDSPWGAGRPGWHIECSAMSMAELGETFDIHTGGIDLAFPHHENEIAQSEGATGKPFVRYWVHAEHLLVDNKKMSKSVGNFYTLRDLIEKGHAPEAIRYLLASVPYGKQLNFTFDGLRSAQQSVERLRSFQRRLETEPLKEGSDERARVRAEKAKAEFTEAMDDDLNTAMALAAVFEYLRDANTAMDENLFGSGNVEDAKSVLAQFDAIFAVLETSTSGKIAAEVIESLIEERLQARRDREWAKADQIRDALKAKGVVLEDSREGTHWHYAN